MMRFQSRFWRLLSTCVYLAATATIASAATIAVPAGGNLQAALDAAKPGDVITLAPGATFVGNFVLRNKGAITDYITVRSAAPDASLPGPGMRMTPAYAAQLPKIRSSNSMSAMQTAAGTNHWKLMFLEFQANSAGYGEIIALGANDSTQTLLSQVPYAFIIDRVYVHGDPVMGQKRGISINSSDTTVINSYVSDVKAIGQDSQAIAGFNAPGMWLIENNYLEGAGENFLLGGDDPKIPGLVTTDVKFLRNHLRKPLSWRDPIMATPASPVANAVPGGGTLAAGTYYYKVIARAAAGQTSKAISRPSTEMSATIAAGTTGGVSMTWTPVVGAAEYLVYGRASGAQNVYWKTTTPYFTDNGAAGTAGAVTTNGTRWVVKNTFEIKNAQDVLVEGNVFENLWVADQSGYPIVFTPRNQNGTAPWVVVQRVKFQNNLIRHTAGGVNILGVDNNAPSQRTNHILVSSNVFDDMIGATWGTGSRPFILGDGPEDITIEKNTVITTDASIVYFYPAGKPSPRTIYTGNMSAHNTYGFFGDGTGTGLPTINGYMTQGSMTGNVLAAGKASNYPAGNFFPTVAAWQAEFADYAGGDYHLRLGSPYTGLGADIDTIEAQTANALSGDNRVPPGIGRVSITTTELPNGVRQQPYSQSVVCTGGAGGCVWELLESSLPNGIDFDPIAGLISGVPSDVQTGSITLEAYDPAWPTSRASVTLALTIDAPDFVLTMPPAPAAQVGVQFALTPVVSGAMGSPTWSVLSGMLPPGVFLDPLSGAIAGTPSQWGSFTPLVQAQDSWGDSRTAAAPVTITVAPAALAVDPAALANAVYRTPYTGSLSATGGSGSITWSITSGHLPAGVTLDANGTLSGTPTELGPFSANARAQDANWPDNFAAGGFAISVDPPSFSITVPPSSAATVGQPYQVTATATGNVGSVLWTIAGSLPGGLSLNASTGTIAGSPTTWGTFNVTLRGADSWGTGRVDAQPLSIVVAPTALAIAPAVLGSATYMSAYLATLTASGGTGAVTWSVVSGRLPYGVTLDRTSGVLSGTPTEVGAFAFGVRALDVNWEGDSATGSFTLTVQPPPFTVVIPSSADGRVGLPLQSVMTSAGQVGSVLWSVSSGSLPPGVALNSATGVIAGVPTTFGSFTVVVKAQDSWAASRFVTGPVTMTVAPTALAITTATLASGRAGQSYQATLAATGGTGLTTWRVKDGVLPAGVTIGANGSLGGTLAAVGTFSFTVEAADAGWAGNVATRALTLTVDAREIVLYAASATHVAGTWSLVADASAAGGARVWNPDAAAAKLTTPLAIPANYFELTFQAEANVAYHLWMRGKADKNAWANDSVYVQFSGSVNAAGAAINRIGTTGAATFSLEDGTNAGLAGWGWSDDSYGGFGTAMYFATSGPQTIRIQVREDGLSLDQIVLSANTYAAAAPGATKNDTTVLVR